MALRKYIVILSDIDPETSTFDCPEGATPIGIISDIYNTYIAFALPQDDYKRQVSADPAFAESFKPKQQLVPGQKIQQ